MRRASLYNTFSASLLLVCNACLSSCVSQIPLTKEKPVNIIRKTKNSSFKNEKSKKEVDVTITVSNKDEGVS